MVGRLEEYDYAGTEATTALGEAAMAVGAADDRWCRRDGPRRGV